MTPDQTRALLTIALMAAFADGLKDERERIKAVAARGAGEGLDVDAIYEDVLLAFATTWAIGQLAKHYYGGGRTLDAERLKAAFTPLVEQGQAMIARYGPAIEERARSIDVRKLPQLIGAL